MDSPHKLLTLPPSHRLGQSSGIKALKHKASSLSRESNGNAGVVKYQDVGTEETDFSHPPAKKPRLQTLKPTVETHDNVPIKTFSLFLPPELPAAIPDSLPDLQEFVLLTAQNYLHLWKMATRMDCVEIRLPPMYEDKLSSNAGFLKMLIDAILKEMSNVKSIGNFYVPKMELNSETDFSNILQILEERAIVSNLYLPLKGSSASKGIQGYDFKSFISFFHKLKLKKITLVSTEEEIKGFYDKLMKEIKRLKSSLKVAYSDVDLGTPGPDYVAGLEEESSLGKAVESSELIQSLNVFAEEEQSRERKRTVKPKIQKSKGKVAFSSDCTYFDEEELNTDGPFTSKIWDLERLHQNGIDGSGRTIAIIDSGINYTHPAFKNKIIAIKNFIKDRVDDIDCAIDSDGHGTHCAGIAAGSSFYCPTSSDPKSESILVPPGVAPGAKLVICKVVNTSNGDVDSEAFLDALHWLKKMHTSGTLKIDVVSISLASTYFSQQRAQVISEMTSLGMIIVCCASNVGRLRMQPISFPARLGQVLCIGAHDENGKPTSFSPVGRELDFLSPGDNLWGPGPGTKGPFAMDCASGTSCATPGVAGLICLILQAVADICERDHKKFKIGKKPLIELIHNVWVMRELLKEISSSPGHHSDEIGYGTLNPHRLLDRSDEEIMRIINEIVEDE